MCWLKKTTSSSTGIIVTDTSFALISTGYLHYCTLNQSDFTYYDSIQLGKFVHGDSLKIIVPGWACPPGHQYYLRKIWPVGIGSINNKTISFYLFPNPAVYSFSIALTGSGDKQNWNYWMQREEC
jgi:hypothetical protein